MGSLNGALSELLVSTSPDSGFGKFLIVLRRDATGVDVLRGLSLKRIGERAAEATLTNNGELTDVLGDLFGLDIRRTSNEARAGCGTGFRARTTPGRQPGAGGPSCRWRVALSESHSRRQDRAAAKQ